MRLLLSVLCILSLSLSGIAQESDFLPKPWQKSVIGSFNLSQAKFSNWAAGGTDSFSWLVSLDGEFSQEQAAGLWRNSFKLRYGAAQVGDESSRKSEDEIWAETLYTFKSDQNIHLYMSASVLTQFTKSYDYTDSGKVAISNFLDPGYFMQSLGYKILWDDFTSIRLGAAAKETMTDKYRDFSNGEDLLVQYGLETVTEYKRPLSDSSDLSSKLSVFYDGRGLRYIDYYWDTQLSAKLLEEIQFVLNYKLSFDRDLSSEIQSMNTMSMGVLYQFI